MLHNKSQLFINKVQTSDMKTTKSKMCKISQKEQHWKLRETIHNETQKEGKD